MAQPVVEFFFDFVSPYTYLASEGLKPVLARTGAKLVYRPMFLGKVIAARGNQIPALRGGWAPYMLRDLARWAALYQVPFVFPDQFPFDTKAAMRAFFAVPEAGQERYVDAMFRHTWGTGKGLATAGGLEPILAELGLSAEWFAAAAANPAHRDAFIANTNEALERGAIGAPTMFVGDEMMWGNDRLLFVEKYLREAAGQGG